MLLAYDNAGHWLWGLFRLGRFVTHPTAWALIALVITVVLLVRSRRYGR